jgi:hypothetical protein
MNGVKQGSRGRSLTQRGEQLIELPYSVCGSAFQGGADVPDVFADVCDTFSDLLRLPRFYTSHRILSEDGGSPQPQQYRVLSSYAESGSPQGGSDEP